MDVGYQGVQYMCWATHMKPFAESTFRRHATYVSKVMQNFCAQNMPSVHKDVVALYERHDLGKKDVNDIMNICVTIDGVYSHTKQARQCTNYAMCPYSGSVIAVETSERCFKCDNCKVRGSVCERGLVHTNDSGLLEVENVIKLFRGSKEKASVRFVEFGYDGDLKVLSEVVNDNPYADDGYEILKTECANHLTKRWRNKVKYWGENWTKAGFDERDKKREKFIIDMEKRKENVRKREERAREKEEKERERAEKKRKREEAMGKETGKGKGPRKGKGKGRAAEAEGGTAGGAKKARSGEVAAEELSVPFE